MYNILLYFSRDSGISLGEVLVPDTSQSQTLKIASSYHFKVYISSSSINVKHTFAPLIYTPNVSRDISYNHDRKVSSLNFASRKSYPENLNKIYACIMTMDSFG